MNGKMELWEGHTVEKVTLSDGEYWMPVCPSGLYVRHRKTDRFGLNEEGTVSGALGRDADIPVDF